MQLAQILGRTLLVYRKHPERPRFEPREAAPAPAPAAAAAKARTAGRSRRGPARRR